MNIFFLLNSKFLYRNNLMYIICFIHIFMGEVALRQFSSRDIYKFVAIDILCYIILFYCIILLFQILNQLLSE